MVCEPRAAVFQLKIRPEHGHVEHRVRNGRDGREKGPFLRLRVDWLALQALWNKRLNKWFKLGDCQRVPWLHGVRRMRGKRSGHGVPKSFCARSWFAWKASVIWPCETTYGSLSFRAPIFLRGANCMWHFRTSNKKFSGSQNEIAEWLEKMIDV